MTYAQDNNDLLPPNVGQKGLSSAIGSLPTEMVSQDPSSPWNRRIYVSKSLAGKPSKELESHQNPFLVTSGPIDEPYQYVYLIDKTDNPTLLTKEQAQTILDEYSR